MERDPHRRKPVPPAARRRAACSVAAWLIVLAAASGIGRAAVARGGAQRTAGRRPPAEPLDLRPPPRRGRGGGRARPRQLARLAAPGQPARRRGDGGAGAPRLPEPHRRGAGQDLPPPQHGHRPGRRRGCRLQRGLHRSAGRRRPTAIPTVAREIRPGARVPAAGGGARRAHGAEAAAGRSTPRTS